MQIARHVSILLTALIALSLGAAQAASQTQAATQALDRDFPRSTVQIAGADGKLHTFRVWVADTDARRERGLMFVERMDADAGMLFIYPRAQRVAMWMKNTVLSLDMLFIAADGRVLKVASRTTPHSLDTIESSGAALGVVELNAGTCERLNIRAGSQVIHPAFLPR